MMETAKLYYEDVNMTEFTGTVLLCRERKGGYEIALDRSCFYPEGGGQPGDRGTLNGIAVTDTHERDGLILHYTAEPIPEGAAVTGIIDRARRFDLTQQHSGEHMVSGVIHRRWGYENVGFHMGADMITIDFSGELTMAQLQEVEQEVNARIWEDTPVHIWYPEPEELKTLPYRSKKALEWPVRIVEFPGADICACCGTHVVRTGEIGLVKILTVQKFHEGVRVEMLAGGRAMAYLQEILEQNRRISHLLSAKPKETAAAVEALSAELEEKRRAVFAMETEKFLAKAEELRGRGNVCVRMEGLNADGVRRAAIAIQETCGGRAAVFSGSDETGYQYAIGLPGGDLRGWVRDFNAALSGRGGGKPGFVQGNVKAKWGEIERYLEQ